jgi:hypothetical protein
MYEQVEILYKFNTHIWKSIEKYTVTFEEMLYQNYLTPRFGHGSCGTMPERGPAMKKKKRMTLTIS